MIYITEPVVINYGGNTLEVYGNGTIIKDGCELRHRINSDGYPVVSLCVEGKGSRSVGVHRLVAMAYVSNDTPEHKTEVHHIDYDRMNCSYSNLLWVTHSENVRLSVRNKPDITGNKNPNYGNKKLSEFYRLNPDVALEKQSRKGLQNGRCKPISLYKDGKLVMEFGYMRECCKYLCGMIDTVKEPESIRAAINRSIRTGRPYKGYTFIKN